MYRETGVRSFWRIGEIMIQKDWITWPQLSKALSVQRIQKRPIGEILVQQGVVTRRHVIRALALQYNVDFVELKGIEIEDEAVRAVPKWCAYEHKIMPLEKAKNYLLIATSNPFNHWSKAVLYRVTGIPNIRNVLACPEDIDRALHRYYGLGQQVA